MNETRLGLRLWFCLLMVCLLACLILPSTALALDFSGTGSQAVGPFHLSGGLTVFSWDQSSGGFENFIVYLLDSSSTSVDLLANELGSGSSGSAVVQSLGGGLPAGDYWINVTAVGNWTLHIGPVTAPLAPTPTFTGTGSAAVGPFYLNGGPAVFSWSQTSGGFENFFVYLVDNNGATVDLLANELGPTSSGSKVVSSPYGGLAPGRYMLAVTAVGSWNMSLALGAPPASLLSVYRFYNFKQGVHFYTASEEEKNSVIARLSSVYRLEGVGYNINVANPANSHPLYRFYNFKQGVHFYTASEAEKANVIATLGSTYRYEGPAYNVCPTPVAGATTVYRFYNFRKGVHFYTASEEEKANVIASLGSTYRYEGPAFYLAP